MNIPKSIQYLGREAVVQYNLLTYINLKYKGALCHFNNNGEDKEPQKIYNAQLLGMKKGFPDLTIIYRSKVLFLELKAEKGYQSKEQKIIEKWIKEQEGCYQIAFGLMDACRIVDEYFR